MRPHARVRGPSPALGHPLRDERLAGVGLTPKIRGAPGEPFVELAFRRPLQDLRGADLRGASLDVADLDDADLTDVFWPEDAPVPAGWKLDTGSGRLVAAGTDSGPTEAN